MIFMAMLEGLGPILGRRATDSRSRPARRDVRLHEEHVVRGHEHQEQDLGLLQVAMVHAQER